MNAVNESAPARPVVTYAIGDVHGRLDLLQSLLALIEADASRRNARAKIVFAAITSTAVRTHSGSSSA